ncbi:uncharacterized protein [Anabrus simplex]|uniref:uncharacterized protein isoform X1 n=1 Tax=Anabrus simplex TaxID=316456 RepID=UPI0034DCCBE1
MDQVERREYPRQRDISSDGDDIPFDGGFSSEHNKTRMIPDHSTDPQSSCSVCKAAQKMAGKSEDCKGYCDEHQSKIEAKPGETPEEENEFLQPSDCCFTPDHHTAKVRPERFTHPNWFTGYGSQKQPEKDLMYSTTSDEYGWYPPNKDTFASESSS